MIFVTGATGTVGSRLVELLKAEGARTRVGVRSPEKARGLEAPNVAVVPFDFEKPEGFDAAFEGVERLFLVTPFAPNQVELAARAVDAAKRAGVKHIVKLSAIGCDMEPGIQLGRWHRAQEKYIEASGLDYTFLRPNNFMDNFVTYAGMTIKGNSAIFMPLGNGAVSYIDARDIAAVAAAALTRDGHAGKAYTLTGPVALTLHEVASALGKALRRQVNYVDLPEAAARQAMRQQMPDWMVDAMMELNAIDKAGYAAVVTDTVKEITGKAPLTISQWAADNVSLLS